MKNLKIKIPGEKDCKNPEEIEALLERKYVFFQNIIRKTSAHIERCKFLDIVVISDVHKCVNLLKDVNSNLKDVYTNREVYDSNYIVQTLQAINNELSSILKTYGTESLEDLLIVCLGTNGVLTLNNSDSRFGMLNTYFHPTSYNVMTTKNPTKGIVCEDIIGAHSKFHMRVYGMNIVMYDSANKKSLQISGIIDDVGVEFISDKYIDTLNTKIADNIPNTEDFKSPAYVSFIDSLVLKDYLLYNEKDIYSKFMGYINEIKIIHQKDMSSVVKMFIDEDIYSRRLMLIVLLINSHIYENQYLAYLLYDTLTNDNDSSIDTQEQTIIYDSFPWSIKEMFRDAMNITAEYTTQLSSYDVNKIPLEQQICLMKVGDNVKEKAMLKLKEVKSKSDDSGGKPRQYLDGLLKIPFGIYRKEDILKSMDNIRKLFHETTELNKGIQFVKKENYNEYTSAEIFDCVNKYNNQVVKSNKTTLIDVAKNINRFIKKTRLDNSLKIKYVGMEKEGLVSKIEDFIKLKNGFYFPMFRNIQCELDKIQDYMKDVKEILDKSVYGHDKAKQQIFRIIGQWINGEQSGYCFGFEGPPGTGKTSLAKNGLSNCLKDNEGRSRPFSMIQMGGDCQGSTLSGHNYTYVGSNWGNIVQILIDKKCMNPIIFIDELDKVSKTEHGKEIIGIMTHMLDPTQNDCFQDKYFSGIDIDLSRVLFIISYNDASLIDRILLDRVHRVKFTSLSIDEKVTISKNYILPEVYKKMGLVGVIDIQDDVIKHVIDNYTFEPGVRKLKELFFEIVAEINLEILSGEKSGEIPYIITEEQLETYLKEKHNVNHRQIETQSLIGSINGMYATTLGTGGVLPITANFFPNTNFFELKLTGLQQEVMKESMHLALTIAWNLTPESVQKKVRKTYEKDNCSGINIHAGDLDVNKEGPSASIAICCVIYSLLNKLPIKQHFAVTGELSMLGNAMAIGGLDHKILGSIKSGVTSFIYPHENEKSFKDFMEKYENRQEIKGIEFHEVKNIKEVFEIIFDK